MDRQTRKFRPLTDDVVRGHLVGDHTIGIYPLLQDETCWFLAVDFDKKTWQKDAIAFLVVCRELNVPAALERSRSGNGGLWQVNAGLREAEFGNADEAKQDVASALALAPGRDVKVLAALTLARVGDVARAEAIVAELQKSDSTNTVFKLYWLPTLNAAIELNKGNSAQALVSLEAAAPYELGGPPPFQTATLYPCYLRGQAYLLSRNGSAAAEFQKLLSHRGLVVNFPLGALAHLGIARAYAMSGDGVKARASYQNFFALWKDADPDIPILKEAKAEYAKLQ